MIKEKRKVTFAIILGHDRAISFVGNQPPLSAGAGRTCAEYQYFFMLTVQARLVLTKCIVLESP